MPALTFADVLKFNPYHDSKGRFATADSATSFTYAPGKSTAHDKAIQRAKDEAAAASGKGFKGTLYHGSPATDIEEFDMSRAGSNTSSGEKLLYFTDSKQLAEDFSYERLEGSTKFFQRRGKKGRVYEVDVEMKNPLDFRNLSDKDIDNILKLDIEGILTREDVISLSGNHQLLKTNLDLRAESLKKLGYDGLIANTGKAGHNALEYAVVDSKQATIQKGALMKAMTFSDILKGNPYHDERGRFTTAPNASHPMIRTDPPPKKTKIAYKVFVARNGKLYPPMVANPDGIDTPVGVWLDAAEGTLATDKDGNPITNTLGRNKVKAGGKGTQGGSGTLAYRPGWHLGELPEAKQFYTTDKETGEKKQKKNFVWAECEIAADFNYQEEAMSYGYNKNGKFQHSLAGLPKIPKDGYYTYRTNPDPTTQPWYITGSMKVNRILTDRETNAILRSHGIEPMKRDGGELDLKALGFTETNFEKKSAPVAKTFADVLKFNPYHDALGRFSTADAASQVTIRTRDPGKQYLADRVIAREKEREAAEAAAGKEETPQMKAIHDIEDQIRNQDYESAACVDKDGNVLFFKDGGQSEVRFNQDEIALMKDNVLTHNHPSSSIFSKEDVDCWIFNDMQEIRATNRLGITYSLSRGENFEKSTSEHFAIAFRIHQGKSLSKAQQTLDDMGFQWKIAKGEITIDQANAEFRKILNAEMIDFCTNTASHYGINFSVEKRDIGKSAGTFMFTTKAAGDGETVFTLDKETEDEIAAAFNEWLDSASKEGTGVQKFNPYHDRLGRFTSAGSEASFTYAPGKSPAHDKAIERHKERMAAVTPTEAQEKTLKGIESRTRNLKKEQFRVVDREGNVVMQKQGDKNSVSYSVGEARDNFPGNITIHNHPDGGTFSTADLSDIGYGATEIRAAAPEGTYTLRNLSHGTKWTNDQKGWHDMREDLDAASQGFKNDRQLKKELRGPYEQQVKSLADRWAKRKAEGASQEELNSIAKEYTEKWNTLQPQLEQAARQAYVEQYHHWYKANAGKYGFEYSFTPVQTKTRKSDTMDEIYEIGEIEKSSGEIILDQKMHDDVQEIVNDILSEYPRDLMQTNTAKSAEDGRAVLFIGLQISGADALAIEGGEDPNDFHVTLAYGHFDGKDEEDTSARVQKAIDDIRDLIPDTVRFDTMGRFQASESSDGKDVIYAQVAAGQLEKAHDGLLEALKKQGIELEGTFPEYKPHMTLAYIEPGAEFELKELDASGTATKVMIGHGWESTHENNYTIAKMDDDKRLVFGWASISITADGEQLEDLQHDLINPEDLEEAVYEYVLHFRDTGEEHRPHLRKKGKLVESCVFTAEKQKAMGLPEGVLPVGWWIGFKIEDDEAWEKVKNGTYRMFSIEGKANRVPVEKAAPAEIAPTVTKADPERFDCIQEFDFP